MTLPFHLLAISDRALLRGRSLPSWAAAVALAGVGALQLREKDLSDRALLCLAQTVRARLEQSCRLLVNGRADVALAAGAAGVHLPADGVPAGPLRHRLGARLLIGRSAHTLAEVAAAAEAGVDFVTFGPGVATPGKGEPLGTACLGEACALGVPVLALGGVGWRELPAVAAAGAAGAAGIRLFADVDRLPSVVAAAREAFAA
jgi:thiamine-phosphate pyrophosphorylase